VDDLVVVVAVEELVVEAAVEDRGVDVEVVAIGMLEVATTVVGGEVSLVMVLSYEIPSVLDVGHS
jgi:hypothetical protein